MHGCQIATLCAFSGRQEPGEAAQIVACQAAGKWLYASDMVENTSFCNNKEESGCEPSNANLVITMLFSDHNPKKGQTPNQLER